MAHDNPSAFPVDDVRDARGEGIREGSTGMDLLDYFAAAALTGCMAAEPPDMIYDADGVAARSYSLAEAMLAERARRKEAGA